MKQRLISFEGIDGSGKSTQINLLAEWLSEKGVDCIIVREPGGTSISERIRDILLDKKNLHLTGEAESFLFLSARAQLAGEIIKPALKEGKFVICDRFIDSTIAYQGYGRGMDLLKLNVMNNMAIDGCAIGQTFLLDVNVENSIKRRSNHEDDRMEAAGYNFMKKVREGYLKLSAENPDRVMLLDGSEPKNEIFYKITERINNIYGELND